MNAVEIEEAVSKLVEEPFNAAEFSYAFLEAFGNKTATLQRLRSVGKNSTNKTDVAGDELRSVHARNDETLERIYIGRRFKNDIERLETLFQLDSQMKNLELRIRNYER